MIVLDADVLLIDIKYTRDPRHLRNQQALAELVRSGAPLTVPTQVALEIVGVMCFNLSAAEVLRAWPKVRQQYALQVLPDPAAVADHCGCTLDEVIAQMVHKRPAGDATVAAQVEKYAAGASAFLTWNLKHFRGALAVPVLTPDQWLQQQTPAGPTP